MHLTCLRLWLTRCRRLGRAEGATMTTWNVNRTVIAGMLLLSAAVLEGCGGTGVVSYGTISTLAGTGKQGYSGDGGAATAALLGTPSCVVVDAAGNVFAADSANHVVRRVSAVGTITTVAGTGTAGYAGDNGAATAAQLNRPNGCALDGAGNLYIADTGNNVVRRVANATGLITTVAGTGSAGFTGEGAPPILAELNQPYGVALDAAGNLYISDTKNQRVRKVNFTANTIVTLAGNGTFGYSGDGGSATAGELYNPEGLMVTSAGDIIVAEEANSVVRKISVATGNLSTLAGSAKYGLAGNGSAALNALLQGPTSVAMDTAGNLYISDAGNNEIRRVDTKGTIVAVVGNGSSGYGGDGKAANDASMTRPRGVAVSAAGIMYIADTGNFVVRKVTP